MSGSYLQLFRLYLDSSAFISCVQLPPAPKEIGKQEFDKFCLRGGGFGFTQAHQHGITIGPMNGQSRVSRAIYVQNFDLPPMSTLAPTVLRASTTRSFADNLLDITYACATCAL